jgi:hypothetical protein
MRASIHSFFSVHFSLPVFQFWRILMKNRQPAILVTIAMAMTLGIAGQVNAQAPAMNPRLFGTIPAVTLAQLEQVQTAAKLTDDQKSAAKELQTKMSDSRMQVFQDSQGDFDKMATEIAKLYTSSHAELNSKLDESQVKRMQELYLQVNHATALNDEATQKMLKITDEQKSKLQDANRQSREKLFSSFQDFQNMSDDERAKAGKEMVDSRDASLMSVLNDEQKAAFEKAKGEAVTIDLSKLPVLGQ